MLECWNLEDKSFIVSFASVRVAFYTFNNLFEIKKKVINHREAAIELTMKTGLIVSLILISIYGVKVAQGILYISCSSVDLIIIFLKVIKKTQMVQVQT